MINVDDYKSEFEQLIDTHAITYEEAMFALHVVCDYVTITRNVNNIEKLLFRNGDRDCPNLLTWENKLLYSRYVQIE